MDSKAEIIIIIFTMVFFLSLAYGMLEEARRKSSTVYGKTPAGNNIYVEYYPVLEGIVYSNIQDEVGLVAQI